MTIVFVMCRFEDQGRAAAQMLAESVGWSCFDSSLPDLADESRGPAWAQLADTIVSSQRNLIVATPMLSHGELQSLRAQQVLSVWIKHDFEAHRPPNPGTLLIDGTMPITAIVSTIRAVLQLAR